MTDPDANLGSNGPMGRTPAEAQLEHKLEQIRLKKRLAEILEPHSAVSAEELYELFDYAELHDKAMDLLEVPPEERVDP